MDRARDSIIEAYKKEIDITMVRESLKRTPQERIDALIAMHRFADEARRARERKK
jgi:hypothetical protein